jgi:alcohol dehydrogenase
LVLNEHFFCPTRIFDQLGWAKALAKLTHERRWLLVTSKGWMRRLSVGIDTLIGSSPVGVIVDVSPNPTVDQVFVLAAQASTINPDLIVALGGGSVLDAAKAVNALLILGNDRTAFCGHLETGTPLPPGRALELIAIPTTGGTGSEVTRWATVWGSDFRKFSVSDERLYPSWALLDPALTASQPRDLTLASGPEDLAARRAMQTAALFAGWAIARTRTALAHSISYPFTAQFGVPHGIACSFTLGEVARFNSHGPAGRLDIVADAFDCEVAKLPDTLNQWLNTLGVGPILEKHVPNNAVDMLAGRFITPSRAGNNIRTSTESDACRIAKSALENLVQRPPQA